MDDFEQTLDANFEAALASAPDRPWLSFLAGRDGPEEIWTVAQTNERVEGLAAAISRVGIGAGDRVATQLYNQPDYVEAILALARLGAVWLPLDRRASPMGLASIVARTQPAAALAHAPFHNGLAAAGLAGPILDPRDRTEAPAHLGLQVGQSPDDWRAIMFTSGTTGLPKGVIVTERMICAAGRFAAEAGRADAGQTFLLWEPLNHIGGAQMIPAALLSGARLAMVPRFSASSFWCQAKAAGATRIHYLGGVLDLLAKQPPGAADRDHSVTHAFGAAARPEMWSLFPDRFGITLTEVYGQTEASSFCIMNTEGAPGAIGRPLPPFDVDLLDEAGSSVDAESVGQIAIAAVPPGLLTPGYLDDPVATAAAFRNGWFLTGDLARRDAEGRLIFAGRTKDAIRRRGENLSALEIETAIVTHPNVKDCALIGIPADIGEEDILAALELVPGATLAPEDLIDWLKSHLAAHQLPRYVRIVDRLPRTSSKRVVKGEISRDLSDVWDAETP